MYRSHGEDGAANELAIQNELLSLRFRLSHYQRKDVFNSDEFGLFYNMPPTTTIGPGRLRGKKKVKQRATFLACCNADGTERYPLLVVGNARCFQGCDVANDGLVYRCSPKAWKNTSLFYEWLSGFDEYISQTRNRRVALLLDNASCHGRTETLPTLHHVDVIYLPARTTSRIQPLDAGIISSVKLKYRKRQLERAIDLIEEGITQNFYMTNMYVAMTIMHEIWTKMDEDTILNCFTKTGLFTTPSINASETERQVSTNLIPNNVLNSDIEV